MRRIHLLAFAYADRGHTREYVTNMCNKLSGLYDIRLYVASKSQVEIPANIKAVYIDIDIKLLQAERFHKYGRLANIAKNARKQGLINKYNRLVCTLGEIREEDVVYLMDHTPFSLKTAIGWLKKIRPTIYLWMHSARFESKNLVYRLYKLGLQFIFNQYVSKYLQGIIVNGDYIKEKLPDYLKFDISKIHTIQYPSEIAYKLINKKEARKILNLPEHENIVLFFGGLRVDKNIEEVIRATAKSKSKPMLIIAGSESTVTKNTIQQWLKQHDHTNYFLDISYVSEENMALYYSASDVLLLTYGAESASQSGPLSLAREFLLPAIVTDSGEIGYYVKHNKIGLVASPEKENDFTTQLNTFFSDKDLRRKLIANLETAKANYSWESAARSYIELFSINK